MSQKQVLTVVTGVIETARGVEVLADGVRGLEGEAKGIETGMKEKAKSLEGIDYLLGKAKYRGSEMPLSEYEGAGADASDQFDDFILGLGDSGRKPTASRKTAVRV